MFYPPDLPANRQLAFYAQAFDTVELDVTFCTLPSVAAIRPWMENTPEAFTFCAKMPHASSSANPPPPPTPSGPSRRCYRTRMVTMYTEATETTEITERMNRKLNRHICSALYPLWSLRSLWPLW